MPVILNYRYILLAAITIITISIFALNPPYLEKITPKVSFSKDNKASEATSPVESPQQTSTSPVFDTEDAAHEGTGKLYPDPAISLPTSLASESSSLAESSSTSTVKPSSKHLSSSTSTGKTATNSAESSSKHAFVSFLQANTEHEETGDDEDDDYFVSTRVLGYQLLHSPVSGTNSSIPFVVVVTKDVSQRKRKRLEKDGATVIEVEEVPNPDWINTNKVNSHWQSLMTKLRVFQLTQFEKILLFDSDIFVVRRMDGIFDDSATETLEPLADRESKSDEPSVPSSYMFAGQAQQYAFDHPYPPDPENNYFGAGFFVAKPSQEIFDYYVSILQLPNRFDINFMEQNLLNYAHRRDGPMPWTDVYYKWTTTYPTFDNYEAGAHSLHHKWWWENTNVPENGLNKLTAKWFQSKGEMEGYYRALDEYVYGADAEEAKEIEAEGEEAKEEEAEGEEAEEEE